MRPTIWPFRLQLLFMDWTLRNVFWWWLAGLRITLFNEDLKCYYQWFVWVHNMLRFKLERFGLQRHPFVSGANPLRVSPKCDYKFSPRGLSPSWLIIYNFRASLLTWLRIVSVPVCSCKISITLGNLSTILNIVFLKMCFKLPIPRPGLFTLGLFILGT
jgi:hypothetical protein